MELVEDRLVRVRVGARVRVRVGARVGVGVGVRLVEHGLHREGGGLVRRVGRVSRVARLG